MKKSDLRTGMIVKLRDGSLLSVIRAVYCSRGARGDMFINTSEGFFQKFDSYTEDLCAIKGFKSLDIIAVYLTYDLYGVQEPLYKFDEAQLLWERDEVEEMTLSQVEELLGKKIKIISEKEEE